MTDWDSWRAHIDQVAVDEGQWVGLLDSNLRPLFDLPPAVTMDAPETRLELGSATFEHAILTRFGVPHMVVDELVAGGLGNQDEVGRLIPHHGPQRVVAVKRPGQEITGYVVAFTEVTGEGEGPSGMIIHAADLRDLVLARWPCPSNGRSWAGEYILADRDWAAEFHTPRLIGDVRTAESAWVRRGRGAEQKLQWLIQDSFDWVNRHEEAQRGWLSRPSAVVDMSSSGRLSPNVEIQLTDQFVWDTVQAPAEMAGVEIATRIWWPGDDPVLTRAWYPWAFPPTGNDLAPVVERVWDRPIVVIDVDQLVDVPGGQQPLPLEVEPGGPIATEPDPELSVGPRTVTITKNYTNFVEDSAEGDVDLIDAWSTFSSRRHVRFTVPVTCNRPVYQVGDSYPRSSGRTIPAGTYVRAGSRTGEYVFTEVLDE